MIKFTYPGTDGKLGLWLGLTQDNLDRLPGNPILFDMAELELPDGVCPERVVIVAGPTDQVIAERLRALGLPIPEFPSPKPGERITRRPR